MVDTALHLLKTRRFLPLFITQFLGAFNDNLFKMAMLTVITYELADKMGINAGILNPLAAGVFILPFVLFSAFAGQFADKYEKSRQVRLIKIAEIAIMISGSVALYLSSIELMFITLFALGTQSTFFGPIKYAILPDHLKSNELIGGNALIESATFISILLGNIIGGLLVLADNGILWTSSLVLACAIIGWRSSAYIPKTSRAAPDLDINFNFIHETWLLIKRTKENTEVLHAILGISWFWLFGSLFLAQFPTYAESVIGADESVLTLFITCFSLGIGVGSMLCSRLLKGEISLRYVPLAALFMTVFSFDLYFASNHAIGAETVDLVSISLYLQSAANWRIPADFFAIAVAGGVYIVPLYATIQEKAKKSELSRMVACNNIINSFFMVASAILAASLITLGFTVTDVFLVGACLNALVVFLLSKTIKNNVLMRLIKALYKKNTLK